MDVASTSTSIIQTFLSHGLVGAVAIMALWIAWKKDQQVEALQNQRVVDAKAASDTITQMTVRLNAVTDQQAKQIDRLIEKGSAK